MSSPVAQERGGRAASRAFALLLMLAGLPVALGGVWLVSLGGSFYYAGLGIAFVASGALLWRGSGWSCVVYAAALLGTWAWALRDGGLDGWILLSRLGFPLLLGCGFLIPRVRRAIASGPHLRHGARRASAATLLLLAGTAAAGWLRGDPFSTTGTAVIGSTGRDLNTGADWQNYGNDPGGTRYSPLDQINRGNVSRLKIAWIYRTGDYPPPAGPLRRLEVTPIKIGDSLYLCSARSKVIALDADTGRPRWIYDPQVNSDGVEPSSSCRGVAWFQRPDMAERIDPASGSTPACAERILEATVDSRLIALDARTGRPCRDFGTNGQVDLAAGLGRMSPTYVSTSSAPVVVAGKVIVNSRIADGQYVGEPGGAIRAYDAVTGRFAWAFDPGNPDDHAFPANGRQFVRGTPNSWAPMSADPQLGLVYVPTGVSTPDYWGGYRTPADERYANSVVALDAATGRVRWSFQTSHHDLWDYDVASQPSLVDLPVNGSRVPALLQPTKRGQLFLLDRRTGVPLADVAERAVPHDGVAGERVAPTQPFSVGMPALDGLPLSESDMWGLTPYDALWCRIRFRQATWEGTMTPPSDRFYLEFPSALGGMNWGGAAIDPRRGIAYLPWNRLILRNRLIPRAEADRMGLRPIGPKGFIGGVVAQAGTPYAASAAPFVSPILGVPCNAPPYGRVTAIDLNRKAVLWTRRVGLASHSRLAGIRVPLPLPMGVPLSGGNLVTRGGLVLLGASGDNRLRAFDANTGRTLWVARLPASANATPMTYLSPHSGRQMIVVAAGGHPMLDTPPGDYIMAYALSR